MKRPLQLSDDPDGDAVAARAQRDKTMAFLKERALGELHRAGCAAAFGSFANDCRKGWGGMPAPFIDWDKPVMRSLLTLAMGYTLNNQSAELRRWIEGFN